MRYYLLSIVFLCCSLISFSQTNNGETNTGTDRCCDNDAASCIPVKDRISAKEILIDFKSKEIGKPAGWYKIKKGDYVRVRVVNYNPFLYKVLINSTDSSAPAQVDAGMLSFFLDPANLLNIAGGLQADAIVSVLPELMPDRNKINAVNGVPLNFPMKMIKEIYYPNAFASDEFKNKIGIVETTDEKNPIKVVDTAKFLTDFFDKQAALIDSEAKSVDTLNRMINTGLFDFVKKMSVQHRLETDYNEFKRIGSTYNINDIENKMEGFQGLIDNKQSFLLKERRVYLFVIASFRPFFTKRPEFGEKDSIIKLFYKEADSVLNSYKNKVSYNEIASLQTKFQQIGNHSSSYVSLPMYLDKDIKSLSIQFQSRYDSLSLPDFNTMLVIPAIQRRIWGVSGGMFISTLYNQSFGVKTFTQSNNGNGTDTLYSVVDDSKGKSQAGINALAYTAWKLRNSENDRPNYFGVSFGAGMSLEAKPKPRILLGFSYINGEKNRLMISLGLVGGNVRKLSNVYDLSSNYKQLPGEVTKDVMQLGGFLSVNYSFLSK